jgi:hypothetical protein
MWFWETSKVFLGFLQMLRSSIVPGLILLMYLQSSTPSAMASNTDIEFGFIASHLARSGSPAHDTALSPRKLSPLHCRLVVVVVVVVVADMKRTSEDLVEVLSEGADLLHREGVSGTASSLLTHDFAATGIGTAAAASNSTGRRRAAASRRRASADHRAARRRTATTSRWLLTRSLRVARLLRLLGRRLLELARRVVAARRRRGRLRINTS